MENSPLLDIPASELVQAQAEIAEYLAQIDRLREQMARNQVEIDQSRQRTEAILAEIRAIRSSDARKAA